MIHRRMGTGWPPPLDKLTFRPSDFQGQLRIDSSMHLVELGIISLPNHGDMFRPTFDTTLNFPHPHGPPFTKGRVKDHLGEKAAGPQVAFILAWPSLYPYIPVNAVDS